MGIFFLIAGMYIFKLWHILTAIAKTQRYQYCHQQKSQSIAKDEHLVLHIQRIKHNHGHADHQNYQIRNTQRIRAFCAECLNDLWNRADTHYQRSGYSQYFKKLFCVHMYLKK